MPHFPIFSLLTEVQDLVVKRVTYNSFVDLYRLTTTCKTMRALADSGGVYASFDLFKYPKYVGMGNLSLIRYYDEGNPSNLYIKGVGYFYRLDRHEEGLALLKRAANGGFERVLYTYAMTCNIFCEDRKYFSRLTCNMFREDGEYFSRFSRETVAKMGRMVISSHGGWNWDHNNAFLTKMNVFISTVVPLFYSCPCSPCLDRDWDLWFIEDSKAEDMCNLCFWITEVGLFLRDFKPCTGFPDFDIWQ